MKKILILGADGYIGTPLSDEYSKENIVYRVTRTPIQFPNNIIINERTNEAYAEQLNNVISEVKPDLLVNLIWGGSFGQARNDYELQDKFVQLSSMIHLLCMKHDVMYAIAGTVSELESELSDNVTEYAKAKMRLLNVMKQNDESMSSFIWLRFANIFGGVDNTGRFVVSTFKKLLNNEDININTTGEQNFNAIYIHDATKEIVKVTTNGSYGIHLIGATEPMSLKSFVMRAKEIMGSNSIITFGDIKPVNIDTDNLMQTRTLISTDIESGIRDTIKEVEHGE